MQIPLGCAFEGAQGQGAVRRVPGRRSVLGRTPRAGTGPPPPQGVPRWQSRARSRGVGHRAPGTGPAPASRASGCQPLGPPVCSLSASVTGKGPRGMCPVRLCPGCGLQNLPSAGRVAVRAGGQPQQPRCPWGPGWGWGGVCQPCPSSPRFRMPRGRLHVSAQMCEGARRHVMHRWPSSV